MERFCRQRPRRRCRRLGRDRLAVERVVLRRSTRSSTPTPARGRAATPLDVAARLPRGRGALPAVARQARGQRGPARPRRRARRAARRAAAGAVHRQRPGRHRAAGGRRRRARRAGGPAGGGARRWSSGPGRSSGCPPTRVAQLRARRWNACRLHRGRAGIRHRHQGHRLRARSGSTPVRRAAALAAPATACRSWRSAASRSRRARRCIAAGAASVAVIGDLLAGDPSAARARQSCARLDEPAHAGATPPYNQPRLPA